RAHLRTAQGVLRRRECGGRPHQRRLLQVRAPRRSAREGRARAERALARVRALQARRLLRPGPVPPRLRLDEGPRNDRGSERARRAGGRLRSARPAISIAKLSKTYASGFRALGNVSL